MAKDPEATAFEPLFSAAQTMPQAPEVTASEVRAKFERSEVPEPKSAKA